MASGRIRLSFRGSVHGEFVKLLSIKSTWWLLGIFGVMAITSEYTNLTVQSALVVNPRRGRYLAAKAVSVGMLSFVSSLVGIVLSLGVARLVFLGHEVTPLAADEWRIPLIGLLVFKKSDIR